MKPMITSDLVAAIKTELSKPPSSPPYNWPVGAVAWANLGTDFDPNEYRNDPAKQNIELRDHLMARWAKANAREKTRLATWIIEDWGGIRSNKQTTIDGYVAMADTLDPTTPLTGVSSYSKVLSMRDPDKFAIYDARVVASLNAIQLILRVRDETSINFLAFPTPSSRNKEVIRFCKMFPSKILTETYGFQRVPDDDAFSSFLKILGELKKEMNLRILQIEMELFARCEDFCCAARSRVAAPPTQPVTTKVPQSNAALFTLSKIEQLIEELAAALKYDDVQTDAIVGRLKVVMDRLGTVADDVGGGGGKRP
jgi:hypothetical protein